MKIIEAVPVIKELKDLSFFKDKPKYAELLECAEWLDQKAIGLYHEDSVKAKRWATMLRELNGKK